MRARGFLLALGLTAGVAFGQSSPDPLDACAAEKDDAARLACFDRQTALRHGAHAAGPRAGGAPTAQPQPAAAPPQSGSAQPPDPNIGLEGAALRKKLKEEGRERSRPMLVSATVARLVPLSHTEYAFELDNGQIWQQTDSRANLSVKVNERVTINAGLMGDFFFNTPDRQRIRVKRIR